MKLKCKQDHWPATDGVFGIGGKPRRQIEGLTLGKVYAGEPVSVVSGGDVGGYGSTNTTIEFLIYNDTKEWKSYQLNLFEPADGDQR